MWKCAGKSSSKRSNSENLAGQPNFSACAAVVDHVDSVISLLKEYVGERPAVLLQMIDYKKESNSYIGDALLELLPAVSLLANLDKMIGQVQGDNPIALGMTFIRSLDFSLQLSEELATEDSSKWTSVPSISVFRKGFILSQQQKQQLLNNVRDGAKTALDRYQKFALKTRNLLEYVLLLVPSEAKKMKASTCQSLCKIS